MIIQVSIPIPVQSDYDFLPGTHAGHLHPGQRVVVPFGRQTLVGYVTGIRLEEPTTPLKMIQSVLDEEPIFTDEQLTFARWISEYYQATLGEVLQAFFPAELVSKSRTKITLIREPESELDWSHAILRHFRDEKEWDKAKLTRLIKDKQLFYKGLKDLTSQGFLKEEELITESHQKKVKAEYWKAGDFDKLDQIQLRSPKQKQFKTWLNDHQTQLQKGVLASPVSAEFGLTAGFLKKFMDAGVLIREFHLVSTTDIPFLPPTESITFTEEQNVAWRQIQVNIKAGGFRPMLLFGVTGSGKTHLYIEALREVLQNGKTGLILVPEIALTPQTVSRFERHFGTKIGVIHSRKNDSERFLTWKRILSGEFKIVIGPRSALFAPLKNLGIIIVDEEHESSYKQFEPAPRYSAKDAAIYRAWMNKCPIILGSATPSFESFYLAEEGKYQLITLKERADDATLPKVKILNMREERKNRPFNGPVAPTLMDAIRKRLEDGQGVILLQNRRGYSNYVECGDCGWVHECPDCSISLTWHQRTRNMRCHYCGFTARPVDTCPKCRSFSLKPVGYGTQQVEDFLKENFPGTPVIRMDQDTTSTKSAHDNLLKEFKKHPASILLGTQMIAKGLDFHHVTLVGVVNADMGMLMPDFRASERTFQLMAQVAGRSGRGKLTGEVIIQTYHPEFPLFQHVINHDFAGYYRQEIDSRKELSYPPFQRMVQFEVKAKTESEAFAKVGEVAVALSSRFNRDWVRGPAAPAVDKVGGWYRQQVLLFIPREFPVTRDLTPFLHQLQVTARSWPKSSRLIIDVEPA